MNLLSIILLLGSLNKIKDRNMTSRKRYAEQKKFYVISFPTKTNLRPVKMKDEFFSYLLQKEQNSM